MTGDRRAEVIGELRKLRLETFGEVPSSVISDRHRVLADLADESQPTVASGDPIRGLLLAAVGHVSPAQLREAAEALFGLTSASYGKEYHARVDMARMCFRPVPSTSTFRQSPRYDKLIIDQIAFAIINQSSRGTTRNARRTYGLPPELSGIRRPQLEALVHASLQGQSRPLMLWGEGGNGKTFLARNVAAEIAAALKKYLPVALIRRGSSTPTDEQTYQSDLIECLSVAGKITHSWSLAAQEREVRGLIASGRHFSAVVLDDVDEATVNRLVPPKCSTPVLITARSKLSIDGPAVRIDGYEDEEALMAIQSLLGSAGQEDLRKLCRILGNRPVAIDIGGRMIKERYATLDELTSALVTDAPVTLESSYQLLGENVETSIVRLYAEVYSRLKGRAAAQAIVDALLWLSSGTMQDYAVEGFLGKKLESNAQRIAHAAGLAWLSDIGLVQEEGGAIEINGLSRTLLRWLGYGRIDEVIDGFYGTLTEGDSPFRLGTVSSKRWYEKLRSRSELNAAPLQIWGGALDVMTAVFDELLGPGNLLILCMGPRDWLISERNLGIFFEEENIKRHAIVTIEESALVAWTSSIPLRPLTKAQALFTFHLTHLYAPLMDWAFVPALPPGASAVFDHSHRFDWFVTPSDEYLHQRIDVYSAEFGAANQLNTWSLCGRRLDISSETLRGKPCPQCRKFRNSHERLGWLADILYRFLFILKAAGHLESQAGIYFLAARGIILQRMGSVQGAMNDYMAAMTVIAQFTEGDETWRLETACGVMERLREFPVELRSQALEGAIILVSMENAAQSNDPRIAYHAAWALAAAGNYDLALMEYDKALTLLERMVPGERPLVVDVVRREKAEVENRAGRS